MSLPVDPYNFTNGTTADAEQVDSRFAQLYAALSAGGLDPMVFAASALTSREVGLDVVGTTFAPNEAIGTSMADVTGATFNVAPVVASYLLLAAYIDVDVLNNGAGGSRVVSTQLLADGGGAVPGSRVGANAGAGAGTARVIAPSIIVTRVSLSAAAHTLKLQASVSGPGSATAHAGAMFGLLTAQ